MMYTSTVNHLFCALLRHCEALLCHCERSEAIQEKIAQYSIFIINLIAVPQASGLLPLRYAQGRNDEVRKRTE